MTGPTGEQHRITLGDATATITELAAGLRRFAVGGVDLVSPYPEHSTPPFAAGIVLVPWPNRVEDGLWHLNGQPQQLDLTEPSKHNAIHGLLRNTGYRLLSRDESSVTLGASVFPQHGYPFHLETSVTYALEPGGLAVSHTIRNRSDATAPVAVGAHPFLTIGDVPAEELVLTVNAASYFEVDERSLPIALKPVAGTRFDLRRGVQLGELDLDTGYADLSTVDGRSATLRAPDGREVWLEQDAQHPYLQVFTPRTFPTATGPGLAVALEPMTAPANALSSGLGLRWLEVDQSLTCGWGIRYSL